MRVRLALEASGPHTEVVVLNAEGVVVHEAAHRVAFQHSRVLPWMLDVALRAVGAAWDDVDWVAWNQGPGYFTALRVSLSVLKALGVARQTPVVPVDAERAFVAGLPLPEGRRVAVGLDAQKQELHVAILEKADPPRVRFPMQRLHRQEVERLLEHQPVDVLVGSGMMRYFADHPALWPEPRLQPSARGVGMLALRLLAEGEVRPVPAEELEPRYGRLPDALVYARPAPRRVRPEEEKHR